MDKLKLFLLYIIPHNLLQVDVFMVINKSLPNDKMKRPKTISELYEEVKDFDIVLTTDAPLASALNREIKTARIGKLAYTPEIFARKCAPRMFDESLKNKIEFLL